MGWAPEIVADVHQEMLKRYVWISLYTHKKMVVYMQGFLSIFGP